MHTTKKPRGISGVVIAVLLTVIGIAAVLAFWSMMGGFFNPPQPKVIIERAVITKIGQNTYDISITVREIGGASTRITKAQITGEGVNQTLTSPTSGKTELSAGSSQTLVYVFNGDLQPGVTYRVRVYYVKDGDEEPSELYPVTVR